MRRQVGTEFRTTYFMFVTIKSQFGRHRNLWFGTKDDFVRRLSSSLINTSIVRDGKFLCRSSPVGANIIQGASPITYLLLVLSFYFSVCHGEWAVRCRKVIPKPLVQLTKSVLRKAVPLSCIIDWGIPN